MDRSLIHDALLYGQYEQIYDDFRLRNNTGLCTNIRMYYPNTVNGCVDSNGRVRSTEKVAVRQC
jgi:hypothetical protein